MSLDVPESGLTSEQLARIANFDRELADALDEAFAAGLEEGGEGGASDDVINVTAAPYNMVGDDGVTDNSAGFAAALAAGISQRKRVWIPRAAGNYKCLSVVTVTALNGLEIVSNGATIEFPSATGGSGTNCITFGALSTRVKVSGVRFQGAINDDKMVNLGAALYFNSYATDIDVIGNYFDHCRPAMVAADYGMPGRFSFELNRIVDAPNPVSTSQNSIIQRNWFRNTSYTGTRCQAIYIYGGLQQVLIGGNIFEDIETQDIQVRAAAARYEQKRGVSITNNFHKNSRFYSVWLGSDTTLKAGGYTVTGNIYQDCHDPIFTQGLADSTITGNTIYWTWEYPIALGDRSGGTAISVASGGAFAQRYGLAENVRVQGNTIVHCHPYFGTVTLDTLPTAGETLTVGTTVYTWCAEGFAAAPGDVEISPGDIPDTLGRLQNAILGTNADAFNDTNAIIKRSGDVFYNAYAGNDPNTSKLVIVSSDTFVLSTTAAGTTIEAVINNRTACQTAINMEFALYCAASDNTIANFQIAAAFQNCRECLWGVNTVKGGSPVVGIANVFNTYFHPHNVAMDPYNESVFRLYRQFLVKDGFPIFKGAGILTPNEYTTRELMGTSGRVFTGGVDQGGTGRVTLGKARTYLWYGSDQYGGGDVNTLLFSWRDGDTVEFRGVGLGNLDLTFKRTAPGAGEFNSAASLIAAINASADWRARFADFTDVGGSPDPEMMIELYLNVAGDPGTNPLVPADNPPRVNVSTRSLTTGQILRIDDTNNYSPFLGGSSLPSTRTAIFSPLIGTETPVFVQDVQSTGALNPKAYVADAVYGVGTVLTHDPDNVGDKEFIYALLGQ
jgi:hypothetical protein